ncbi:MAG: transposase zinc-binding domain-containing protein [gamma proteobacterium symbiont of Taylorina sp.]|nr:transposase zinc-binding domain-containing protein [gamma proteobacterium symbiont of Taylorina sp.]
MDANNKDKDCHHHSPGIYQPRHPEKTVLYQIVLEDLETWIKETQDNGGFVSSHIEKNFRSYLKCGLLCYGFARARCTCGNEFLVAFSCNFSQNILHHRKGYSDCSGACSPQ